MNELTINDTTIVFKQQDTTIFTDSLTIAKVFGKVHYDMVKVMKREEAFDEFLTDGQISVSKYKDDSGKSNSLYLFDRDSFSYFIMGFTGKEAKKWKLDYIKAFNAMEKELLNKPKPLTNKELLQLTSEALANEEVKREKAERLLEQAKVIGNATKYTNDTFSVDEFCKIISSKLENVSLGRTTCYIILRSMKLVEKTSTKPSQYGMQLYLDYRSHDYGFSTRIHKDKADSLVKYMIKHLQKNTELNEALAFPLGDL